MCRLFYIRAVSKYGYGIDIIDMKNIIYLFIILLTAALCSGCRTIEYRTLETVRSDTVYIQSAKVDSVMVRDSIYIYQQGDTILEHRYHYIYRYKDRVDTLYLASRDTISVPYPVEKELTRWQSFKVDYGGWAIGAVFGFVLIVFGSLIYKLKKK